MSRTSTLNRSSKAAVAIEVLAALLSPASAADRQDTAAVYPDVSSSAASDRATIVLTSRLPGKTSNTRRPRNWTGS